MFNWDDHVGELAELYALGELSEAEGARVNRHAGQCPGCAKRIGDAESTVLRLIEGVAVGERPPARAPSVHFAAPARTWAWVAAVAAAFLIGLLPWGVQMVRDRGSSGGATQLAMNAMLTGHFIHSPFMPLAAGAPAGKVIYAREGGWFYVIVGASSTPLDVAVVSAGKRSRVASIGAGSTTRAAFFRTSVRVESVQLLRGQTPVASAGIAYFVPKER
jgi:hypothetical protein